MTKTDIAVSTSIAVYCIINDQRLTHYDLKASIAYTISGVTANTSSCVENSLASNGFIIEHQLSSSITL